MKETIFSRLVYDVDNRYVDLEIRSEYDGAAFMLTMTDTSDEKDYAGEIELYLTRADIQLVIDRLTKVLE